MIKSLTLALLATAFLSSNESFADVGTIKQNIERLEKHLNMITSKFGGELGAEEEATQKKIEALYAKLEGEKVQAEEKGEEVDPEIAKLEARLKKIQDKFGIGGLSAEEDAINEKIATKKGLKPAPKAGHKSGQKSAPAA